MSDIIPPDFPLKQCPKCKGWFPATLDFFHASKQSPSRLKVYCKACRSAMAKDARRKKHPREILPDGYKRCSDCKEVKPATTEHFRPDPRYAYGVASRCKICTRAYQRQRNAKRRPPREEIPHGFRRCTLCKELFPATTEYFNKKLSGLNARCKTCTNQEEYRERIHELQRCWRENNREYLRQYGRLYDATHPEKIKAKNHKRRAFKQSSPGTHTEQDIQMQYDRQKGKCYYCHVKVGQNYHVDHIIPLSRGGSNDPSNLVIACPFCNDSKGNLLPHEWRKGNRLL